MAFGPCFLSCPEQKVEELVKNMQAQIKFVVNLLMLMNNEVKMLESKVHASPQFYPPRLTNHQWQVIHLRPTGPPRKSLGAVNDKFKKFQDKSKKKAAAGHHIREEHMHRATEATKEEMSSRKQRSFSKEDVQAKAKEKEKKKNFMTYTSPPTKSPEKKTTSPRDI